MRKLIVFGAFRESLEILRRLAVENLEKHAAAVADAEEALEECHK